MSEYIVLGKGYYTSHYSSGGPLREYGEVKWDTYAVEFRKDLTTLMTEAYSAKCDYEVPYGEDPPRWPAAGAFKPFGGLRDDWIEFYQTASSYDKGARRACGGTSDPSWITKAIDTSDEDVQCQFLANALAKGNCQHDATPLDERHGSN